VAADSLRLTRRIAAQPALAKYQPREVKPGVQFQTDEELARLAGDIGTTIFHPVGTCRMGRGRRPDGGGRPALRVRGVAGPAHGRRQRDAHHHQRQHQLADADDRRARGGADRRAGGKSPMTPAGGAYIRATRSRCTASGRRLR
jgi:hypothetical protein